MTQKDAAMFPIIASAALFGLYVFFQVNNLNVQLFIYIMINYNSLHLSFVACFQRLHQLSPNWLFLFLGYFGPDSSVEPSCHQIHTFFSSQNSLPFAVC